MNTISIPGVSIVWKQEKDLDTKSLGPEELKIADIISHPEKRNEFILGRQAIKEALLNSGAYSPLSIGRMENGAPILPSGYCGSISHTKSTAMAAAGSTTNFKSIGVDIESMTRSFDSKITKRAASTREAAWISEKNSNERTLMLVSAKEALYKMLYPLCGVFFGMQDVELIWNGEGFKAVLKKDLSNKFKAGDEYRIGSYKFNGYIVSIGILYL